MKSFRIMEDKLWRITVGYPPQFGEPAKTTTYHYAASTFNDAIDIHNVSYSHGEIKGIEQLGYVTTRVAQELI